MLARAAADPERSLAAMGYSSNIDFSLFDLDEPIGEIAAQIATNGHQSSLESFIAANANRTLREVGATSATGAGKVELVGTPDQVAAQMDEVMEEVGGDGFLIRYDTVHAPHHRRDHRRPRARPAAARPDPQVLHVRPVPRQPARVLTHGDSPAQRVVTRAEYVSCFSRLSVSPVPSHDTVGHFRLGGPEDIGGGLR